MKNKNDPSLAGSLKSYPADDQNPLSPSEELVDSTISEWYRKKRGRRTVIQAIEAKNALAFRGPHSPRLNARPQRRQLSFPADRETQAEERGAQDVGDGWNAGFGEPDEGRKRDPRIAEIIPPQPQQLQKKGPSGGG